MEDVLVNLGRHEVLTLSLFSRLIGSSENSIAQTLRTLQEIDHVVFSNSFKPDDYRASGMLPNAYWLSAKGAQWVADEFPATYPRHHDKYRSVQTIPHDIACAETHIAIYDFCVRERLNLGWQKANYSRKIVKPDGVFEITGEKTAHYFLELENKKKKFKSHDYEKQKKGLYDKFKPYVDFYGTSKFKDEWGFRYFNVIIPMRDAQARDNVLVHFAGGCNCLDPKNQRLHKNAPFKLQSDILWFTTYEDITTKTDQKIFYTPKDYEKVAYSFLST